MYIVIVFGEHVLVSLCNILAHCRVRNFHNDILTKKNSVQTLTKTIIKFKIETKKQEKSKENLYGEEKQNKIKLGEKVKKFNKYKCINILELRRAIKNDATTKKNHFIINNFFSVKVKVEIVPEIEKQMLPYACDKY